MSTAASVAARHRGDRERLLVADYAGGGTGYQTAQEALNSVLAQHPQELSATGSGVKDKSAGGETFTSGTIPSTY